MQNEKERNILLMKSQLRFFTFILGSLVHSGQSYRTGGTARNNLRSFLASEAKQSIWGDKVQYVDPNNNLEDSKHNHNTRELPLFLLSGVFYPQGATVLNIFEMKYRTMMFDVAKSDDTIGYIHVNSRTGQIASVGTLCKVVERQLLDDGRQYIALEGMGRFKVHKITQTLPYMVAQVQHLHTDDPVENEDEAHELEREVYKSLRYYMYLIRTFRSTKNMVISTHAKHARPTLGVPPSMSTVDAATRRSNFSFALANMMQMTVPREAQLLLQTTDVVRRLEAQRSILQEAAQFVANQLVKSGALTEENRQEMHRRAYREDDRQEEIFPAEDSTVQNESEDQVDEWDISNMG